MAISSKGNAPEPPTFRSSRLGNEFYELLFITDLKGDAMKACTVILAFAALFAITAPSLADDPILLKNPLPPGLILPRPMPLPTMPPAAPGKIINLLCFSFDIGADGFVHNMRLLRSTGDAELDKDAMTWWQQKHFEPATLNGVPVTVRDLGHYAIGRPSHFGSFGAAASAGSPDDCSWELYDSQTPAKP